MVDIEGLQNWTRWAEKEESGMNRGYAQAYLNRSRADHFVLIGTRELEYKDEYKVTVKPHTNGDWKPDWSSDRTENFTGPLSEADALQAEAEDYAREFMADHPCEREGEIRDAVEALSDLIVALRDEGLVPQHDCGLSGWTGRRGSTGYSLAPLAGDPDDYEGVDDPRDADILRVNMGLDGKASGLTYRKETRYDNDGESRRHHEPHRPEKLVPKVERALEAAGFSNPVGTRKTAHQTHWDYSTDYTAYTEVPDDLNCTPTDEETRRNPGLLG